MEAHSRFELARRAMVKHLRRQGIRSRTLLAAMGRVRRENFVPPELEQLAYADRAVPIGLEQTISQPFIVALMTQSLELTGTERVLEIGTGSGYQTAVLAELAAEVITIERHADLAHEARRRLTDAGYRNITFVVGDGTLGWPDRAPYARILVAAAADHVPQALLDQLAEGGTLVIPVGSAEGQTLQAYCKRDGRIQARALTPCRFVPLVGAQGGSSPEPA